MKQSAARAAVEEIRASRRAALSDGIDAVKRLRLARVIARKLRDAKSNHPWTTVECELLAWLCNVLGVEELQ